MSTLIYLGAGGGGGRFCPLMPISIGGQMSGGISETCESKF